jgi:hypothetical protein
MNSSQVMPAGNKLQGVNGPIPAGAEGLAVLSREEVDAGPDNL